MIHSQNLFSTFFDTCWSVVLFLWMVMFVFLCFVKRYKVCFFTSLCPYLHVGL